MPKKRSTRIADKLLETGVLSERQHQSAIQYYNNFGVAIEDAIIDSKAMEEEDLVKWLAQVYKTRFVTTSKLKKADIGQKVLQTLSYDFANANLVFPILFDANAKLISIVTSDPTDMDLERAICAASGAVKVRAFVARPAAIKAAIAKFYKGDIHAFTSIDQESVAAFQSMMDVYERNLLDEGDMVTAIAETNTFGSNERVLSADDMERSDKTATTRGGASVPTGGLPVEIARVMVSLMESTRQNLSGHSVLTANNAEKVCTRIGVSPSDAAAITMAALLHDIGKGDPYHLTAFNVAEWDGHKTNAQKRVETPIRLFESANLPTVTVSSLRYMYERMDGRGFPEGLKGADIPLGARILAIADTYADLTNNPRNPYRRKLTTPEAMEVLNKGKNTIFDGNLVDLFAFVVSGDDIKRQLLTGAQSILVVDSDAEQCAILEMQLTTRGFKVRAARGADEAIRLLLEEPAQLILSEVDLHPFDGFELLKRLTEDNRTKNIPFFYFTSRAAAADVDKGFSIGASDYLVKPSTIDVVSAKIQKFLQRAAPQAASGGVSGSLKEMSIPDLVQIISHGRKTGQLNLSVGKYRGEIHFVQGDIYNALFDRLRGEEAFFAMLKFREGNFSLNPAFKAESKVIGMTAEMLLLEGMRRLDEDNR